jgi:asparagine synthase (glutamine-hydrolysing)
MTFSGGVDSGLIAALAAKKLNHAIPCMCIDYHTPENPSEETVIARRVAEHLGLPLSHIHFDYPSELLPLLTESYRYYCQPISQMGITFNLRLYRTIKQIGTAVLSGAGGDELFAGYIGNESSARTDARCLFQRLLPRWLRLAIPGPIARRLRVTGNFPEMAVNAYRNPSAIRQAVADELQTLMLACDVNSHMDLLMFAGLFIGSVDGNYRLPDISGLQAQVEVRSPLLDYRFVEFASKLPTHLKIGNVNKATSNKWILKRLYEKYVPKDIAWARKKGMGWNIKWDHSFVNDPNYIKIFEQTMDACEIRGIDTLAYRQAFEQYQVEKRKDMMSAPPCGSVMAIALMQGQWLLREAGCARL